MEQLTTEQVGNIIRYFRKKAGITQFQLAEYISIDDKQLGKIERGVHYPSLPTFLKLIKILNINIDEFYYNKNFKIEEDKLIQLIRKLNPKQTELAYKIIKTINQY